MEIRILVEIRIQGDTNLYGIVQFYLAHDTQERLNCIIDCFRVNINKNWLRELTYNFGMHLNEIRRRKENILVWTTSIGVWESCRLNINL